MNVLYRGGGRADLGWLMGRDMECEWSQQVLELIEETHTSRERDTLLLPLRALRLFAVCDLQVFWAVSARGVVREARRSSQAPPSLRRRLRKQLPAPVEQSGRVRGAPVLLPSPGVPP